MAAPVPARDDRFLRSANNPQQVAPPSGADESRYTRALQTSLGITAHDVFCRSVPKPLLPPPESRWPQADLLFSRIIPVSNRSVIPAVHTNLVALVDAESCAEQQYNIRLLRTDLGPKKTQMSQIRITPEMLLSADRTLSPENAREIAEDYPAFTRFSPRGDRLFVAYPHSIIEFTVGSRNRSVTEEHDTPTLKCSAVYKSPILSLPDQEVTCLFVRDDVVAVGTWQGAVVLFDTIRKDVREIVIFDERFEVQDERGERHIKPTAVTALDISTDGKFLAASPNQAGVCVKIYSLENFSPGEGYPLIKKIPSSYPPISVQFDQKDSNQIALTYQGYDWNRRGLFEVEFWNLQPDQRERLTNFTFHSQEVGRHYPQVRWDSSQSNSLIVVSDEGKFFAFRNPGDDQSHTMTARTFAASSCPSDWDQELGPDRIVRTRTINSETDSVVHLEVYALPDAPQVRRTLPVQTRIINRPAGPLPPRAPASSPEAAAEGTPRRSAAAAGPAAESSSSPVTPPRLPRRAPGPPSSASSAAASPITPPRPLLQPGAASAALDLERQRARATEYDKRKTYRPIR